MIETGRKKKSAVHFLIGVFVSLILRGMRAQQQPNNSATCVYDIEYQTIEA